MTKIGRNDPCPCGSGKKYKKCCEKSKQSQFNGLSPSIRMKGGVRFDETVNGYIAIVHTWDNAECIGVPKEWHAPEVFQTEDKAMTYYQTHIRPKLQSMMAEMQKQQDKIKIKHNKLE
jgi:hypothetical protein